MADAGRQRLDAGLDTAVRDAIVASATPWLCASTGFLIGLLTIVGLPALLFYHACILAPSAALGHLPEVSPYPACVRQMTAGNSIVLLAWPYILGTLGAIFGYVRRCDILGSFPRRWLKGRFRPYHALALATGYLAYGGAGAIAGSLLLVSGAPLLAILSGPALVLFWQYLHDRLLLFLTKPSWEHLVAATVLLWLPRRLAVPKQALTRAEADVNGQLNIYSTLPPGQIEEARYLAATLPGVRSVEMRDLNGVPIRAERPSPNAGAEASRIVAQLKRTRERMLAAGAYSQRRVVITDYSGRVLVTALIIVILALVTSLTWVTGRGGYRWLTAEDLQWFFGKYGPGAPASDTIAIPKSIRPPGR
jgi:hypothetical protein